MRLLIFGATGMIGSGVLLECIADSRVTAIRSIARAPLPAKSPKLEEVHHEDFFDYGAVRDKLAGHDACFFCLGVSAAGMSEARYHRLTYELTVAAAHAVAEAAPGTTFCYLSAQGADSGESSRIMWARVRGKTENELLRMPLDVYIFRPGIVQPLKGVRSKTPVYRVAYTLLAPFHPLVRRFFPRHITTTGNMGKAMLAVARSGHEKRILENPDINELATAG